MKAEPRKLHDGRTVYSFVVYDAKKKKRVRVPQEVVKRRFGHQISDAEEATQVLRILSAEYDAPRLQAEARVEWEKQYQDHAQLAADYAEWQKKKAPNSWRNNVTYLRHYVIPYFLVTKGVNNIELWPDYFVDYRDWLESDAKLTRTGAALSYGSKNHAIKALNTFLKHLYKRRRISKQPAVCETFDESLLNVRGVESVLTSEEMEIVYLTLSKNGWTLEATFFRLLFFTGLRFNEALGLSVRDISGHEVPRDNLKRLLERDGFEFYNKGIPTHAKTYFGFVRLMDQPSHPTKALRGADGHVARKPLKGCKAISEENTRLVPILDKLLYNSLASLFARAKEQLERKEFGGNPADYCLFSGLDKTTAMTRLRAAYKAAGVEFRTWHALRHTRATWLAGESTNTRLGEIWLGHKTARIFKKYDHLNAQLVQGVQTEATIASGLPTIE